MKNPNLSVTVHGIYLVAAGIGFVLVPNLLLPLFGFGITSEVWIRIVGLLTLILGMYFIYCARHDQRYFIRATIAARLIFFTGVTAFVLLRLANPILIVFGLIDLAGAAWTTWALRAAP